MEAIYPIVLGWRWLVTSKITMNRRQLNREWMRLALLRLPLAISSGIYFLTPPGFYKIYSCRLANMTPGPSSRQTLA